MQNQRKGQLRRFSQRKSQKWFMDVSDPLLSEPSAPLTLDLAAALDRAQTLTSLLFPSSTSTYSNYSNLTTASIVSAFGSSDPRLVYLPGDELVEDTPVIKLAKQCGLAASNCTFAIP